MNKVLNKFLPEQMLQYFQLQTDSKENGDETFEPKDGIIIHYIDVEGAETVISIDAYEGECEDEDDDGLCIVTEHGIEHCGEYEIDSPIPLNQFKVYKEVKLD